MYYSLLIKEGKRKLVHDVNFGLNVVIRLVEVKASSSIGLLQRVTHCQFMLLSVALYFDTPILPPSKLSNPATSIENLGLLDLCGFTINNGRLLLEFTYTKHLTNLSQDLFMTRPISIKLTQITGNKLAAFPRTSNA